MPSSQDLLQTYKRETVCTNHSSPIINQQNLLLYFIQVSVEVLPHFGETFLDCQI